MKRRRMTVHEFKMFIEGSDVKQISFNSKQQDWYDPASPAQFKLTFQEILIYENPDSIYLYGDDRKIEMVCHNTDYICIENKPVEGRLAFRIVSHTYPGAISPDLVLTLN